MVTVIADARASVIPATLSPERLLETIRGLAAQAGRVGHVW